MGCWRKSKPYGHGVRGRAAGNSKRACYAQRAGLPRNNPMPCPPDGRPFLLGPDAQTTGGYPRIAQVILADRHLIGQLSPGAKIQFVNISPQRATEIFREKLKQLRPWLGAANLW